MKSTFLEPTKGAQRLLLYTKESLAQLVYTCPWAALSWSTLLAVAQRPEPRPRYITLKELDREGYRTLWDFRTPPGWDVHRDSTRGVGEPGLVGTSRGASAEVSYMGVLGFSISHQKLIQK